MAEHLSEMPDDEAIATLLDLTIGNHDPLGHGSTIIARKGLIQVLDDDNDLRSGDLVIWASTEMAEKAASDYLAPYASEDDDG